MRVPVILFVLGMLLLGSAVLLQLVPVPAEYTDTDPSDMNNDGKNDSTYSMLVTLESADGQTVNVQPYRIMAFMYESTVVTKMTVRLSCAASGTDLDMSSLTVTGTMKIVLEKWSGETMVPSEKVNQAFSITMSLEGTGSVTYTYNLADLLLQTTTYSQRLAINADFVGTVDDIYGNTLTDPAADAVTIPFTYKVLSGTFSLQGGIGYTPFSTFNTGMFVVVNGVAVLGSVLVVAAICFLSKR